MSVPPPAADPTGSATSAAPPAEQATDKARPVAAADPGQECAQPGTAPPEPDVRSGGHAGRAPKSLAAAEAHWQEHDSSGSGWDSRESI
jgi:hypothetical protein